MFGEVRKPSHPVPLLVLGLYFNSVQHSQHKGPLHFGQQSGKNTLQQSPANIPPFTARASNFDLCRALLLNETAAFTI